MSKHKFTPAPWMTEEVDTKHHINHGYERLVATITPNFMIVANDKTKHDKRANARLIEQSPNMLKLLEEYVFFYDHVKPTDYNDDWDTLYERAKETIAKVVGDE